MKWAQIIIVRRSERPFWHSITKVYLIQKISKINDAEIGSINKSTVFTFINVFQNCIIKYKYFGTFVYETLYKYILQKFSNINPLLITISF